LYPIELRAQHAMNDPPGSRSVSSTFRERSPPRKCPRQDSNLYAVSGTGPSNQPVYQFQHVGDELRRDQPVHPGGGRHARGGTRTLTGLPPQDPESCASTNSATRALGREAFEAARHGAEGNRTPDLLNAIQALSQLSYGPSRITWRRRRAEGPGTTPYVKEPAGLTRLELATSGVTDRHSNRLSYSP